MSTAKHHCANLVILIQLPITTLSTFECRNYNSSECHFTVHMMSAESHARGPGHPAARLPAELRPRQEARGYMFTYVQRNIQRLYVMLQTCISLNICIYSIDIHIPTYTCFEFVSLHRYMHMYMYVCIYVYMCCMSICTYTQCPHIDLPRSLSLSTYV